MVCNGVCGMYGLYGTYGIMVCTVCMVWYGREWYGIGYGYGYGYGYGMDWYGMVRNACLYDRTYPSLLKHWNHAVSWDWRGGLRISQECRAN